MNRPHFNVWTTFGRQLLEENRTGSAYIVLTGYAGETGSIGVTSVGAAIQIGVARTAIHEAKTSGTNVKVNEILLGFLVRPDAEYAESVAAGKAAPWARGASFFAPIVQSLAESSVSFETIRAVAVDAFPALVESLAAKRA